MLHRKRATKRSFFSCFRLAIELSVAVPEQDWYGGVVRGIVGISEEGRVNWAEGDIQTTKGSGGDNPT